MLRNFKTVVLHLTRRPPVSLTFGRHVRGGVAPSTRGPDQGIPQPSTLRFGYGVRRTRTKEEELVAETEPSQRLASFYGHPRLPPTLDEEEAMVKVKKPAFDDVEEDTVEEKSVGLRPVEDEQDLIDDFLPQPASSQQQQQLGQYEPLAEPVPAPKRKPRAFLQTYTLTPLVNDSELLRNLVDLGVNLSKFDTMHNVADWLLKLDWDKDVRPVLRFLGETAAVPLEKLGEFVTANPWILQQSVDDLQVRIKYLESKKFSKDAITRIVTKAKYWLNFHVKTVDTRLGWLQKTFELSGDEVRFVVTHSPKLVTMGTGYTQLLQFSFKEEMGFKPEEMRQLMLKDPRLWRTYKQVLIQSFDYLHNKMGLSHQDISAWPSILRAPRHYLKQRHEFLKSLGRDQFDPTKPNYISLQMLGKLSDKEFAEQCAKTSIAEYNAFLKKF